MSSALHVLLVMVVVLLAGAAGQALLLGRRQADLVVQCQASGLLVARGAVAAMVLHTQTFCPSCGPQAMQSCQHARAGATP
jgi:hypothetical protein